jgi:hypothetical protein
MDWTGILDRSLLDEARLLSLRDLCLSIDESDVPGCIVEVGVYRGGSAKYLAQLEPDRAAFLFDTFAGIPHEPWEIDGHKRGTSLRTSRTSPRS